MHSEKGQVPATKFHSTYLQSLVIFRLDMHVASSCLPIIAKNSEFGTQKSARMHRGELLLGRVNRGARRRRR